MSVVTGAWRILVSRTRCNETTNEYQLAQEVAFPDDSVTNDPEASRPQQSTLQPLLGSMLAGTSYRLRARGLHRLPLPPEYEHARYSSWRR